MYITKNPKVRTKYRIRKVSYPESIVSGKYLQQIYFSIKILKIYLCLELFFSSSGKYRIRIVQGIEQIGLASDLLIL